MTLTDPSRRRVLLGVAALGGVGSALADPVIRVGPGRAFRRIADAARAAPDGSVVEIDAGDYVGDVAVWEQARLTIRGVGGRVRLLAAGRHAEGKGIWVVRRGQVTVEDIEFEGAAVPDRNGAGIRLESGQLAVRRCRFMDSETGILTGNEPSTRLEVEASEFGRLGAGDGLSHGLYVGAIASLRLSACHVHHANVGHLVKSRARWNRIERCQLVDGPGGRASYELEFPSGGIAEVVGNVIDQGTTTENPVLVSFGAEGTRWPENRLLLEGNTLVNRLRWGGTFVHVHPDRVAVASRNNRFVGSGRVFVGPAPEAAGDLRMPLSAWAPPGPVPLGTGVPR